MADVKKLVFSIIRFLQDQRTQLEEEQSESLEGKFHLTPGGDNTPSFRLNQGWQVYAEGGKTLGKN